MLLITPQIEFDSIWFDRYRIIYILAINVRVYTCIHYYSIHTRYISLSLTSETVLTAARKLPWDLKRRKSGDSEGTWWLQQAHCYSCVLYGKNINTVQFWSTEFIKALTQNIFSSSAHNDNMSVSKYLCHWMHRCDIITTNSVCPWSNNDCHGYRLKAAVKPGYVTGCITLHGTNYA